MTVQVEFKCDACGKREAVVGLFNYPVGWLFFSCDDGSDEPASLCYCSESCARKYISEFRIEHWQTPVRYEEESDWCRRDTVFENCSDISKTAIQYVKAADAD